MEHQRLAWAAFATLPRANRPFPLSLSSPHPHCMSHATIEQEFLALQAETIRYLGLESALPDDFDISNASHRAILLGLLDRSCSGLLPEPANQLPDPVAAPDAESDETCSNLLTGSKSKCAATNRHGQPCGAYQSPGSPFCPFHRPEYAETMAAARTAGGRRSPYKIPDEVDPDLLSVDLHLYTRGAIQASLEAVMRLIVLGRIPPAYAHLLFRGFQVATQNLNRENGIPGQQREYYEPRVERILRTSGLIERDLKAATEPPTA